jgi:hypothetical protein
LPLFRETKKKELMNRSILCVQALAALLFALPVVAHASETPAPAPSVPPGARALPMPYPKTKLHTEFVVEVNAKGQVVRVRSGKSSQNLVYNAQTYGNVLQMWIRHPDGTAVVGVYRVTYDYDPESHKIKRGVALLWAGGNWGHKEGAANEMLDIAKKEKPLPTLPPLKQVIATPTPHAHP